MYLLRVFDIKVHSGGSGILGISESDRLVLAVVGF